MFNPGGGYPDMDKDAVLYGGIDPVRFRMSDIVFFFFSSRRRHTRSDRDWSSDVCSSDLEPPAGDLLYFPVAQGTRQGAGRPGARPVAAVARAGAARWRASAAPAVGPARIRRHRAGRRRRLLHLSTGVLRRTGRPQD